MIPVIAGIPFIAGLVGGLASECIKFFARFFTRKIAVAVGATSACLLLLTALVSALYAALGALSYTLPDEYARAMNLFIPDNLVPCISAVMTGRIAKYSYEWSTRIIQWTLPGM